MPKLIPPLSEAQLAAFWSKVDQSGGLDACWPWTAPTTGAGYGYIYVGKRQYDAHRVSWALAFDEQPGDMHVLHDCDFRRCVNPTHLFLGTAKDNSDDKLKKNREARGEIHGSAKLTEDDVRFIRHSKESGRSLAKQLKVSPATISLIRNNIIWRHLTQGA